jgi:hypothetical protein
MECDTVCLMVRDYRWGRGVAASRHPLSCAGSVAQGYVLAEGHARSHGEGQGPGPLC